MYSLKEIDAATLNEWLTSGRQFRLVDVRSPAEFAQGMIPAGEQLPLHLLPLRANEFSPDTEIVFYCRSGARSGQACMYLSQLGIVNVYNLRGGIMDWARQGFRLADAAA